MLHGLSGFVFGFLRGSLLSSSSSWGVGDTLIARLAGRNKEVLQGSLALVDAACKLDPREASALVEQGYQRFLLGDVAGASAAFARYLDRAPDASDRALIQHYRDELDATVKAN